MMKQNVSPPKNGEMQDRCRNWLQFRRVHLIVEDTIPTIKRPQFLQQIMLNQPEKGFRNRQYGALLLMNFLSGWFVASVGPLIPHYTTVTGLDETDYAYLFMVRSAANVLGGLFSKYLLHKMKVSALTIIYSLVVVVSLIASTFSLSTFNLSITLFFSSICLVGIAVIIYGVTIKLFLQEKPDYWIQLLGFTFAIGAMCGPFFVYLFELQNFKMLGLAQLLVIACLAMYPLPDLNQNESQSDNPGPRLSTKSVLGICAIFVFYATIQLGMASWIPTYSIKAGVADVNSSAIYSLLFWLPNCFSRLAWMYVPGSVQQRLGLSLKAVFLAAFIPVILQYFQCYQLVCIFAPIASGILIGGVFGFGISLPVDSGFAPCAQNNANFILANALGEGLLIMPLGYSLSVFGYKAMMVEMLLVTAVCYWVYTETVRSMDQDKEAYSASLLENNL